MNRKKFSFFLFILFHFFSCKKYDTIDENIVNKLVNEAYAINDVEYISPDVAIAAGGNRRVFGYIWRTTDAGLNWTQVYSFEFNTIYDIQFLDANIGYACGENFLLLKTTDGGVSWNRIYIPVPEIEGHPQFMNLKKMIFFNETSAYLVGGQNFNGGTIIKTTDGGISWQYELYKSAIEGVYFFNESAGVIGGYGSMRRTIDSGQYYELLDIKNDYFNAISFLDNTIGFSVGYNGGIYKTADAGATWIKVEPFNKVFQKRTHFNDILFINNSTGFIAANKGIVLKTTDGGDTWQEVSVDTDENFLSVSKDDFGRVHFSTSNGKIYTITL